MASELSTVTSLLSKEEIQYQIDIFMHCYKIIENILYSGHLHCLNVISTVVVKSKLTLL